MQTQKSLKYKVLEQMKKRLEGQIKAIQLWTQGNHCEAYFDFFNKMREDMNREGSPYKKDSTLFQKDFDHLNKLEANYKKQMKMLMCEKTRSKLVELSHELSVVNESLYYIQLE